MVETIKHPGGDASATADSAELRDFERAAADFVSSHCPRREPQALSWGVGPEKLTLFHETSDAEERAEVDAARAWQRARWDAGFGWICGPPEFGGRGLPEEFERTYRLVEAGFEVPDMSPLRIGIGTVGPAIVALGSPTQIAEFARPIQRGDVVACQLFSEPSAGSDLAGVRTRGVRVGDRWVIDGQKVWNSNAQFADIGLTLVRTDPEASKHRGLTMFLVPMGSSGVSVRPLRQMTGGASFTEVFLDGVEVDDRLRLSEAGNGWTVATSALAGERKATGDRSHELTERAIQMLRELGVRSNRFTDPHVRQAWTRTYCALRIARFQQKRVQSTPESSRSGAERAMDKLLVAANLRGLGDVASDILGPRFVADTGEWATFGWNKWLMGSLGYRVAGGTEEILKTMLAERVLNLPREPR